MPRWTPKEVWKDQDVFLIGGGSSLKDFDWNLLKSELTIGCNTAFTLGKDVCKICIFGDAKWFHKYSSELENYGGVVFTNAPQLVNTKIRWLWTMMRRSYGLHFDALGWNDNTGASAINLALLLGAKRIFLLGFDMQLDDTKRNPNWHNRILGKTTEGVYSKFLKGFDRVVKDLKAKFPNREVINVNSNSKLAVFPMISPDVFWKERMVGKNNEE